MSAKLCLQAICKFLAGVLLVGVLIFAPAGTLSYWNGWLLMGILFVPMLLAGSWMLCRNPGLLKSRLQAKETQREQNLVVKLSGLMFLAGFILAALDYRFQWTQLPGWIVLIASVVLLFSYGMYAEVMRENAYLSRTVEIQENQKVIDTGLYGIVRHPMYSSTILLFLSIPLVLGSGLAFLLFLCYPALIIKRIKNEEELLEAGLVGYCEYKQKVKYRLIPFVW